MTKRWSRKAQKNRKTRKNRKDAPDIPTNPNAPPPNLQAPTPSRKAKSVVPQPTQSYQSPSSPEPMDEDSNTSLMDPLDPGQINPPQPLEGNTLALLPPQNDTSLDFFNSSGSPSRNARSTGPSRADSGGVKKRRRTGEKGATNDTSDLTRTSLPSPSPATTPTPHPLGLPLNRPTMTGLTNSSRADSPLPPARHQRTAPALMLYSSPNPAPGASINSPASFASPLVHEESPPGTPRPQTPGFHIADANVTGFLGDNPLTGMDTDMKEEWTNLPGPKALIYEHDASYSPDEKGETAEKIEMALVDFLSTPRPKVTAPLAAKTQEAKKSTHNRRPWCFLVTGLSEESVDMICEEAFISNKHATIHILRFNPKPAHFIGRIRNLTYEPSRSHTIESLIKDTIRADPNVKEFITTFAARHNDLLPPTVTRNDEALEWIIESVKVYSIQNGGNPSKAHIQWKWYIFTPTCDPEQVANWTKILLDLPIRAGVYGHGETLTSHRCARCKSTNHTPEECPFTKRSKYIADAGAPKTPTSNTRGGGRGRGRGRGRGSRRANFD